MNNLPESGFVRITQIVGKPNSNPPIPPLIPVSRATWWRGVKSGRYPQPIRLSPNVTVWKVSDIRALIENDFEGCDQ